MKNKVNRFERKWIHYNNDHLPLINSLLKSKLFFNFQYPSRKVNSIYFDTNEYSSIRQNLDGVSNKKKVRVRWYGKEKKLINPYLEIKRKKGLETKKEFFKINKLNNLEFSSFQNLNYIKDVINNILKSKKILYPILTTHYDREYFESSNKKIRATIDYNLESVFLKNLSEINQIKRFNYKCILEIKYSLTLDKFIRKNLNDITLRLSKNSKYINSFFERPSYFL